MVPRNVPVGAPVVGLASSIGASLSEALRRRYRLCNGIVCSQSRLKLQVAWKLAPAHCASAMSALAFAPSESIANAVYSGDAVPDTLSMNTRSALVAASRTKVGEALFWARAMAVPPALGIVNTPPA